MNLTKNYYLFAIFLLLSLSSTGCAAYVPVTRPGEIPSQGTLSAEDEEYGQAVYGELAQRYQISSNDAAIERARNVVDRITKANQADHNPWHVNILVDDNFKNAAATRGNFIFIWTGLLNSLQSDDELATVLSHEIAHALAGHTAPDPQEEVAQITGSVLGEVANATAGAYAGNSVVGQLAGILVQQVVAAVAINPNQQAKELEADQVGLFLMADAGYNPQAALDFWRKAENDPAFQSSIPGFLSTHPAADERSAEIAKLLPAAITRYQATLNSKSSKKVNKVKAPVKSAPATAAAKETPTPTTERSDWVVGNNDPTLETSSPDPTPNSNTAPDKPKKPAPTVIATPLPELPLPAEWEVITDSLAVYESCDKKSPELTRATLGDVLVSSDPAPLHKDWIKVNYPYSGCVLQSGVKAVNSMAEEILAATSSKKSKKKN
jgi:predicted Zn-dependent protease